MIPREPEETVNSELETGAAEIAEIEDIETLKQALIEEKARAEDYLASWQRAQADFINYKRRSEQEKSEYNKFANSTLILSLLPVLDDLERAFASLPPKAARGDWVDGIRLIERKLRTSLEAQGLRPIQALGEPFDPSFHEAVRQDKGKEGIIIEELRKGYMLNDRVLRPTAVVVGNGEETAKEDK